MLLPLEPDLTDIFVLQKVVMNWNTAYITPRAFRTRRSSSQHNAISCIPPNIFVSPQDY